jgi:hypothetical protein
MFITCLYAILEPEGGGLLYANAGHSLPYRRRAGRSEDTEEPRARRMPLGLTPQMSYEEKQIRTASASSERVANLAKGLAGRGILHNHRLASRQSPATKSSFFTSSITLRSEARVSHLVNISFPRSLAIQASGTPVFRGSPTEPNSTPPTNSLSTFVLD